MTHIISLKETATEKQNGREREIFHLCIPQMAAKAGAWEGPEAGNGKSNLVSQGGVQRHTSLGHLLLPFQVDQQESALEVDHNGQSDIECQYHNLLLCTCGPIKLLSY